MLNHKPPLLPPSSLLFPRPVAAPAQLYKEAGVPSDVFIGVPVFQAEGLTVTTQDMVGDIRNTSQLPGSWQQGG
jgi:hypothetical protein